MGMPGKTQRTVHCPQCHVAMTYDTGSSYRPFCSERCKLIDLGQWAAGAYRIAQVERDNGPDQPEDLLA